MRRRWGIVCVAAALILMMSGPAWAANFKYVKDFEIYSWEFGGKPADAKVEAEQFVHTWARNAGAWDQDWEPDGAVAPGGDPEQPQPPKFDPHGTDRFRNIIGASGVYNRNAVGAETKATMKETAVLAAGLANKVLTVNSNVPPSNSSATSTVDVNAFGARSITGTLTVEGDANAVAPPKPAEAYAYSFAGIEINDNMYRMRDGSVKMEGKEVTVKGTAETRQGTTGDQNKIPKVKDPMYIEVWGLDETGALEALWSDVLFDMLLQLDTGLGSASWEGDVFTADAPDLHFTLDLGSEAVAAPGKLALVVENGFVTESDATGVFAGVALPGLGTSGPFSFDLSNTLDFAWSLDFLETELAGKYSGIFDDLTVVMGFDDEGGVYDVVPEPATVLLLGLGVAMTLARRVARR